MSKIKVNSLEGVGASTPAISIDNSSGTCTANITNNLSNRNLIINGAMLVAQRGTTTTTNGYLIDRFRSNLGGLDQMQFTMSQSTDAPTGFRKSLKFDVTTAETGGIGSDEYAGLRYIAEAQDVAHLLHGTSAAKTFTLSFHVKAYQTGTYVVNFYVGDSARIYNATYTISQSATWEKKTLTVVGDTSGSGINVDNGHGIYINWFFASGSAYTSSSSALNQWSNYQDASWAHGQAVDITTSTNNYFQLAGVQFELGSVATDFEHRTFAQELELCRRYYQKSYNYTTAPSTATNTGANIHTAYANVGHAGYAIQLAPMRNTPTATIYSTSTGASGKMNADSSVGNGTAGYIGESAFFAYRTNDNTGVGGDAFMRCHYTADAEL